MIRAEAMTDIFLRFYPFHRLFVSCRLMAWLSIGCGPIVCQVRECLWRTGTVQLAWSMIDGAVDPSGGGPPSNTPPPSPSQHMRARLSVMRALTALARAEEHGGATTTTPTASLASPARGGPGGAGELAHVVAAWRRQRPGRVRRAQERGWGGESSTPSARSLANPPPPPTRVCV
jgi:hypothetical protein